MIAVVVVAIGGIAAACIAYWFGTKTTTPAQPAWTVGTDESLSDAIDGDVLEAHPMGVVVASPDGAIEYRNAAAAALVGTHVGVLIDGAIAEHLRAARVGTPSAETLELFGPPKRVVVVTGRRLASGRSVAFVDDITERHRADRVRTDFVANVSHELRTPIGALMVLAETLVDADDPDVVRRVVGRMLGEAERASLTIDDLIELSHVEAGTKRDFRPVQLGDVVREAIGRAAELAEQRNITITMIAPDGRAGSDAGAIVVSGDRRQLVSAVGNIVENAVKYSDSDDRVRVQVRREGDWAEVAVSDEGPGIPQHDLDRIFERFYRVDGARSRSTGGTGLGLSIVRHVARNHGGDVSVESSEGEGAKFVLRLPIAVADESPADGAIDEPDEGVA